MLFVDGGNDRVGIGTTPSALFHIRDGSVVVGNGATSNNAVIGRIGFSTDASNSRFIGMESSRGGDAANADLRFHTFGGDGDNGERMRIDTAGRVSIGHTSSGGANFAICDGANSAIQFFPEISTDTNLIQHYDQTTTGYMNAQYSGLSHTFFAGTTTVMSIENSGQTTIFDHTASANNQALNVSSKCTSRSGLQVTAQNASYGNSNFGVIRLETIRSSSNAFQYAIMRSGDGSDIQFQMRGDGNAFADNNWNAGGADYAEYFEWKDGNSSSEDRRGYTVVLDGNQIRKSTSDDAQSSILGVVSATPAMVGDSGQLGWQGKHERDEWGSYIFEEYTQTEWTDADGELKTYQTDKIPSDVTVPSDAVVISTEADGSTKLMRRKESSSYDASLTYIPREDRKEWDTIGLMGKLKVRVGQTVGDRWIKMREISDTVHEYLVR